MLTPHCSAVSGMVAPSSTAPITRARKSSEYGFAIHAGLLPAGSLNHIRAGMGIPLRFSLFGKRSNSLIRKAQKIPLHAEASPFQQLASGQGVACSVLLGYPLLGLFALRSAIGRLDRQRVPHSWGAGRRISPPCILQALRCADLPSDSSDHPFLALLQCVVPDI